MRLTSAGLAFALAAACGGPVQVKGADQAGGSGAAGATSSGGAGPAPKLLLAGAAAVEFVPAAGSPLAGFGAAPRRVLNLKTIPLHLAALAGHCLDPDPSTAATLFVPNQGTLDKLMVRALVLDNGQSRLALLKLDGVGFVRELRDDLLPVAASLGIPAEQFVGVATHTHSGAGAVSKKLLWQLLAADCYSARAYTVLYSTAVEALIAAAAALRPAEIGIASTQETQASRNRRGRPAIFDPEMGVIKVVDAASRAPIAALMNFAIHGTAYGADNLRFSADVMGVAEREIERRLGAGVALFTNGAEGDVAPADGLASGVRMADTYLAAWPAIATRPWVELAGAFEDVPLPRPSYNTGCFPIPLTGKTACEVLPGFSLQVPLLPQWAPQKGPFQALRIGEVGLAALPGEPETEIGWEIKKRGAAKGFAKTFVLGLANDHLSYLTTRAEYQRGLYEGQSTLYGPGTGELAIEAADRVLERVRPHH